MKISKKQAKIKSSPQLARPKTQQSTPPKESQNEWYVEANQRFKFHIKELTEQVGRRLSAMEERQIDFLEKIQDKIFSHLILITPETLIDLINITQPIPHLESALLSLQTLFSGEVSQWREAQDILKGNERDFIMCLQKFQDLTLNEQFEKPNIIKAKNHLIKSILDDQLSQIDQINDKRMRGLFVVAEGIISFVEVYDALKKSLKLQQELQTIDESNHEQSKMDESQQEIKEFKSEQPKEKEKIKDQSKDKISNPISKSKQMISPYRKTGLNKSVNYQKISPQNKRQDKESNEKDKQLQIQQQLENAKEEEIMLQLKDRKRNIQDLLQQQQELKNKIVQEQSEIESYLQDLDKLLQKKNKNVVDPEIDNLKLSVQISQQDHVQLESELNRLLQIIDYKAKQIPEQNRKKK